MIFKFNLCAYSLLWTVQKFSGFVVVFVETFHTENNLPNNTRGNRLGRIRWERMLPRASYYSSLQGQRRGVG
jgi:hypothetical protein